ncbi:MAG: YitT family protein [Clostridia bacterium]|nr:YitT family protein [Clostridia bacterium]
MLEKFRVDLKKEGKQLVLDYLLAALGSLLLAFSFTSFFIPHDVAPGGISGLSTVIASMIPVSVGVLSFTLNLPLFMLGWRTVGWRFAVRSFVSMTLVSLFIDLLPPVDLTGNVMLASMFGGVIMGVGLGLVVRAGATTGGTDMAANMLHKIMTFLSIPVILFMIDAVVVIIACLRFGVQAGFYALISLYVSTIAMDGVIKGVNTAVQFMIITSRPDAIIRRIHTELERGVTRLEAEGTYSKKPVGTLICVISKLEMGRLKKIVREEDARAFVTVCDVHEALGEGFTGLN